MTITANSKINKIPTTSICNAIMEQTKNIKHTKTEEELLRALICLTNEIFDEDDRTVENMYVIIKDVNLNQLDYAFNEHNRYMYMVNKMSDAVKFYDIFRASDIKPYDLVVLQTRIRVLLRNAA